MYDKDQAVDASPSGPSMLADLMRACAAHAVERGLSLDQVAAAAGLAPNEVIAPSERVPEDAVSRILGLLAQEFPGEPVALEMAAAASVNFLGLLAPVARMVPDLRTGIQMFVDYRSVLSTSAGLEFIDEPPGPMLCLDHPNDREFGAHGAEMGLMMGKRAIADVFGVPDALRMVWIDHPATGPEQRYVDAFEAPVRFEAPSNALLFHRGRLNDPVDPDAGPRLRVVRSHLELVRQQLEQADDPAELRQIRDAAARNAAHGEFSAAALTRRLGVSLRTLQRRCLGLDTSVHEVIEEVRAATARQLLSDPELNLLEISLALGYSSDSAFRRAFRRWTGQSPAAYRQSPT